VTATIVPITPANLAATSELLRRTLVENGIEPNVVTEHYVAGWIGNGAPVLGARVGGHLVGYAMLERGSGATPYGVVALSVLQHYRCKGLGERLMRALLAEARRSGEIDEVWLSVAPDNLPALALYEKLGFVDRAGGPPTLFVPATYVTMLWRPDR
jgi:[ribosomal protein S18]-alanine N-acetyltransferase